MGCNCGKSIPARTNAQPVQNNATNGANQLLLKRIADQQAQQAAIQKALSPNKTTIKTIR